MKQPGPARVSHRRWFAGMRWWLPFAPAVAVFVLFGAPGSLPPMAGAAVAGPAATASVPPPTDLRVPTLAYDDTSITLAWTAPADHTLVVDYHVYQDGHYLGRASDNPTSPAKPYIDAFYADPANSAQVRVVMENSTVTGLRPATVYRFTVRSVDAAGTESVDSPVLTQATTATPRVFNVVDYGAVGDGTTLDTAAIQAAIDACTPGGKVVVPAGVFVSGAIWLKSNMTFQVAQGATLLGSANADDYPYDFRVYDYSTDKRFYSLINAHTYDYGTLTNIRIVGPGTIDGNGWKQSGVNADGFPVSMPSSAGTVAQNGILAKAQVARATALGNPTPYVTRSNLITLRGVTNAYYGGFTARNPAQHTIVNLHDTDVTVDGVRMETNDINNADGIEFGNSQRLTVINNVFDTGDDCVNFAAGLGAASQHDQPSGNAWIADNYFREGHGAVVAGSHTGAWVQDIVAEDNVMNHTDVGLRMKTDPNNGGGARRIQFRDSAMKDVSNEAFIFTSAYSDSNAAIAVEPASQKAQFTDVLVDTVTVDGTGGSAIKVVGVPDQYHQSLYFRNVRFLHANPTNISYLQHSWFTNVVFDTTPNPWVVTNSTGLTFEGSTTTSTVTTDTAAAPTWPSGSALTVRGVSDTSATLAWPAASDNIGVAAYVIYNGGSSVATVTGTTLTYRVPGLAPRRSATFQVVAQDATGNTTAGPTAAATTTGIPDGLAPAAPSGTGILTANPTSVGTTWVGLRWKAATDNYGVQRYDIAANGRPIGSVAGDVLAYTATGLTPGTSYTFAVTAVDTTGNAATYPATVTVTTAPRYDAAAPVWPGGQTLRASAVDRTSVTLVWTAASDDIGVTGYRVYQDGRGLPTGVTFTPVDTAATVATTTYRVTGLQPNGTYTFTVQAGDAAGKWTGSGPQLTVTTQP